MKYAVVTFGCRVHQADSLAVDDGRVAVTDNDLRVSAPPGQARTEWIAAVVPGEPVGHDQPSR